MERGPVEQPVLSVGGRDSGFVYEVVERLGWY